MADTHDDRGVWHSKSGAKGQSRFTSSQKLSSGLQNKKESQAGSRAGAGRGHGTTRDSGATSQEPEIGGNSVTNSTALADEHTPTTGYNARAVEVALKVAFEPRPSTYKPAERQAQGGRSSSAPWGSKRLSSEP